MKSIGDVSVAAARSTLVSMSVFDVVNVLECNVVACAAVNMIDGDQGMVALSERKVVVGLRRSIDH